MRWQAAVCAIGFYLAATGASAAEEGGVERALALSQKSGYPILAVAGTKT